MVPVEGFEPITDRGLNPMTLPLVYTGGSGGCPEIRTLTLTGRTSFTD